jgi:RNA polymerase sigma-70 factor (ECF subfamily)
VSHLTEIEDIISSIKKGETSGYKALFQKYYSYVMSICLRYTRNNEDAEEVLNDAFMKVFKNIHSFRKDMSFNNWLSKIAVNTSIDHLRKQKTYIQFTDLHEDSEIYETHGNQWNDPDGLILKVLQGLSPQYRMVFNLYVFEDYKHEEIAEKLNISIGTSKSNYFRAKKIVMSQMNNYPKYQKILKNAI